MTRRSPRRSFRNARNQTRCIRKDPAGGVFDFQMGDHLTGNFAEAGQPVRDEQESVFIGIAHITRYVESIAQRLLRSAGRAMVASHAARTVDQKQALFAGRHGLQVVGMEVKLLRVIETRRFSPVGDTALREFRGKLIAATNRVLPLEIREHRFREDLYYRLCADLIETPSLADQIDNSPEAFHDLLLYMVRRAVGDEAPALLPEVEQWIKKHLPPNYRWPGNYRELEQCVRNIVIRRSYRPIERNHTEDTAEERFFVNYKAGRLKLSEVISHYVAQVYRQTGSYEETARRLELDRRTVKAKVQEYLAQMGIIPNTT